VERDQVSVRAADWGTGLLQVTGTTQVRPGDQVMAGAPDGKRDIVCDDGCDEEIVLNQAFKKLNRASP
jgi:hypothetical protein